MTETPIAIQTAVIDALKRVAQQPPNMLRSLLAVQEVVGYVPPGTIPAIAYHLGVTDADVAGVLSFYPHLRTRPRGRHLIRICMGESCLANHCTRVLSALGDELRIGLNATTPDGRFTLERVYCVGNCAVSPSIMVDDEVHGRVTPSDVPALLEKYR
jgi:NADH:ubiquinone oxidoreductase subunit E